MLAGSTVQVMKGFRWIKPERCLQIDKWFLEKRAIEEEDFSELPSEEEGGSNALAKAEPLQEVRGSKTQKLSAARPQKTTDVFTNKKESTRAGAKGSYPFLTCFCETNFRLHLWSEVTLESCAGLKCSCLPELEFPGFHSMLNLSAEGGLPTINQPLQCIIPICSLAFLMQAMESSCRQDSLRYCAP